MDQSQSSKPQCPMRHPAFIAKVAESEERLSMPQIAAAVAEGQIPGQLLPKQELMGLLTQVIAKQWEQVTLIRRESPECCGLMMRDFFGTGGYVPLSDRSIVRHLSPVPNESAMSYALRLSGFMDSAMHEAFERSCQSPKVPDLAPVMLSRLERLIAEGAQVSPGKNLRGILRGGQATSITAAWSFLGSLPHLFERMGEKEPSGEQLGKAADGVFRFMTSLSAHNFHAFVGLFQLCRTEFSSGNPLENGVDPSHVALVANGEGSYEFCPSTQVADRVVRHVMKKAAAQQGGLIPTTGCPALFAAAGEGVVIPELLSWVKEVAQKYYFPYVVQARPSSGLQ